MDTFIGKVNLTDIQIQNFGDLKVSPFKGFSYAHDTGVLTGVSDSQPTQSDIDSALQAANGLSKTISKATAQEQFDVNSAKLTFYQDFIGSLTPGLIASWGVLSDLLTFKNFQGIKIYRDALVANGTLTAQEVTIINGIFTAQGVDLDNL